MRESRRGMHNCIVVKFSPRQVTHPHGGLLVNKSSKVLFNNTVNHLNLAIGLEMIGQAHPEKGASEPKKVLQEVIDENWITIRNQTFGKTMLFVDHRDK